MRTKLALAVSTLTVLAACSSSETTESSTAASSQPADTTSTAVTKAPTSSMAPVTTVRPEEAVGSSAADVVLPEVLAATPRQGEGPYYPDTKPDDHDNDLLVVDGGTEIPVGTPLEISGLLVDIDGAPIAGATIEIWQVDGQGIYDHRRFPGTDDRDLRFQFYGESITDDDGFWTFLTLDPVLYESRPRHIHTKVKIDGDEALTTQIYFEGDEEALADDSLAALAGDELDLLTAAATPGRLSNGLDGLVATHVLVLDT